MLIWKKIRSLILHQSLHVVEWCYQRKRKTYLHNQLGFLPHLLSGLYLLTVQSILYSMLRFQPLAKLFLLQKNHLKSSILSTAGSTSTLDHQCDLHPFTVFQEESPRYPAPSKELGMRFTLLLPESRHDLSLISDTPLRTTPVQAKLYYLSLELCPFLIYLQAK